MVVDFDLTVVECKLGLEVEKLGFVMRVAPS
jgi:hypothetical protein